MSNNECCAAFQRNVDNDMGSSNECAHKITYMMYIETCMIIPSCVHHHVHHILLKSVLTDRFIYYDWNILEYSLAWTKCIVECSVLQCGIFVGPSFAVIASSKTASVAHSDSSHMEYIHAKLSPSMMSLQSINTIFQSIDQLINLHYQSTIDQLDRSGSNHYHRIMVPW